MLTDMKLKNIKPRDKPYKLTDRDGLCVTVLTTGSISFRYNYRINGKRDASLAITHKFFGLMPCDVTDMRRRCGYRFHEGKQGLAR